MDDRPDHWLAPSLRQLLLFEVGHEGRATAAMAGAARLGGLSTDLAAWELGMQGRVRAVSTEARRPMPT